VQLDLTSEQEIFREATARFIDATCPLTLVRQLADGTGTLPSDHLRRAAELGWFAPLVPEEHGGGSVSGEGLRDVAVIAEERGRTLQPGPFVSMNVVAAALVAAGTAAQQASVLPAICRGQVIATWAFDEGFGSGSDAAITVTEHGDGFELSGRAAIVEEGVQADWFLVSAGGPEGDSQFLLARDTPGVTARTLGGLDITRRLSSVHFEHVTVPRASLVGAYGGGSESVDHQLHLACVLTVAETIGALDALFEMTRQYASERIAFGRPIGSFQAVKHQLADMSLYLESGKAIASDAVRAMQGNDVGAGEIVSMAKWWVGDAGIDIAQGCFQTFGGIGFTWEHDLHLFLRRITTNSILFGQPDWHRERICRLNGL
jgi:alkylation response protein AidB-like acyl-CoA dehydrogenase